MENSKVFDMALEFILPYEKNCCSLFQRIVNHDESIHIIIEENCLLKNNTPLYGVFTYNKLGRLVFCCLPVQTNEVRRALEKFFFNKSVFCISAKSEWASFLEEIISGIFKDRVKDVRLYHFMEFKMEKERGKCLERRAGALEEKTGPSEERTCGGKEVASLTKQADSSEENAGWRKDVAPLKKQAGVLVEKTGPSEEDAVWGEDVAPLKKQSGLSEEDAGWGKDVALLKKQPTPLEKDFSGKRDIEIIRCDKSHIDSLLPLQVDYTRVEVLPPWRQVFPAAERISLEKNFSCQLYFALLENGKIVSKANTNAISTHFFQIGGVYTLKDFRSRGYASALVKHIALEAKSLNRQAILFVKKENPSAIRAYSNAGFVITSSYKIIYYLEK